MMSRILSRSVAFGVRQCPLELDTHRCVREVVEPELVGLADRVRPVSADAEPHHVRNDEKRRVLERQRVLAELGEGRVQVRVLALVLPREAVAFPHVRPAVATPVLACAALEAVGLACGVGLRWDRLAEQAAQIDEVLLRGRALLQLRRPPLGDEFARGHVVSNPRRTVAETTAYLRSAVTSWTGDGM